MPDAETERLLENAKGLGARSDVELVGYAADPRFDAQARSAAGLEMNRRLLVAIRAFSDTSTAQAAEVIKLTMSVRWLTWVLVGVAVIQVLLLLK